MNVLVLDQRRRSDFSSTPGLAGYGEDQLTTGGAGLTPRDLLKFSRRGHHFIALGEGKAKNRPDAMQQIQRQANCGKIYPGFGRVPLLGLCSTSHFRTDHYRTSACGDMSNFNTADMAPNVQITPAKIAIRRTAATASARQAYSCCSWRDSSTSLVVGGSADGCSAHFAGLAGVAPPSCRLLQFLPPN